MPVGTAAALIRPHTRIRTSPAPTALGLARSSYCNPSKIHFPRSVLVLSYNNYTIRQSGVAIMWDRLATPCGTLMLRYDWLKERNDGTGLVANRSTVRAGLVEIRVGKEKARLRAAPPPHSQAPPSRNHPIAARRGPTPAAPPTV
ncbi:hypothetical protein SRHO_G00274920 [Serrasalmus rhombeus]